MAEYDEQLSGFQDLLNDLLFEHCSCDEIQVTWLGDNRWLIIPILEPEHQFVVTLERVKVVPA